MSYNNPTILAGGATGFDAAIESIRAALAAITWLDKSFGRAWEFKETLPTDGKNITVPKVFIGQTNGKEGEYHNVLPNDFLKSQSFIRARGSEEWTEFNRNGGSMKSRPVSVILWVNLKEIDVSKNYIFTEELKSDVEEILRSNPYTLSMDNYFDERVQDIFDGYDIVDETTQYLMYPYAGMRFDLTLTFPEPC